ncbi:MAG: hypothetical protein AB1510_07755 [Bacillota bacterium]
MLAEYCIRLQAFVLPAYGTATIAPDIEAWCYPDRLEVTFSVHTQVIERKRITRRYKVRCPSCGDWKRVLYLPPGGTRFLCRKCAGVTTWAVWQRNSYYRVPKRPDAWARWFARRCVALGVWKGGETLTLEEATRWLYKTARRCGNYEAFREEVIRCIAKLLDPILLQVKSGDTKARELIERLVSSFAKK